MAFFANKADFTHTGRFYGVPLYLNLNDSVPVVAGTNIIFDWLFSIMVLFHNTIIEFGAQLFAFLLDYPYEAGFPFIITGEIKK